MEGGVTLTSGKKPESLLHKVVSNLSVEHDLILDFFVGSGTAAAVAHKTRRRWVAVEGDNSVFPLAHKRLKLVLSGEESGISRQVKWQGGGFFKYQVLEQYEDTLNNLELPRAKEGELALKQFGDEYLLRYMLDFETAGSASLLAVEQLRHPFDYRLKVQEGDEIAERTVDMVETFNYLLGLHVKKLRMWDLPVEGHAKPVLSREASGPKSKAKADATERVPPNRTYRAVLGETRDGKSVVVVWRDTEGLESSKEALQRDRQFIEGEILPALLGKDTKPDRLLVNQPYAGEAEAIETEFKRLMFAPIG
jgi:adenine-specific DNA-methyltransferase